MLRTELESILNDHAQWYRSNGQSGRKADLRGADLRGADLRAANLHGAVGLVCLPVGDPRSYRPVAVKFDKTWRIYAGCRDFSAAEALVHWGSDYEGDSIIGKQYVAAVQWLLETYGN